MPITVVIGLPSSFQNTGDRTIVSVGLGQINNMIAHFTVLFIITVCK